MRQISNDLKSQSQLETAFFRSGERTFSGYVVDPANLARTHTIDILIDGRVVKAALANEYVQDLSAQNIGDACYGFSFSLDNAAIVEAHVVEARLSNLGIQIGAPVVLATSGREPSYVERQGTLRWLGGLRFSGWLNITGPTAPTLDVIVDGITVSRTKALGWSHVSQGGERGHAARSFDFHLPERFADGCVHHVDLTKDSGESIGPAPLPFLAFADGLVATLATLGGVNAERLRGELFDRLLPQSIPISHYEDWCERFPVTSPAPVAMKGAVVLVGPGNIETTLPSLEEQTHENWIAASLLAAGRQTSFDPGEAREFLGTEGQDCDFVVFGLAGSLFSANAMGRIAEAFNEFQGASIVYGDIDVVLRDGGKWPIAFPAFDYERMLEQGYCSYLFAMRRETAQQALISGASDLYRLFNSAFDQQFPQLGTVIHLPRALATIPPINVSEACQTLCDATSDHLIERGTKAHVTPGAGAAWPAVRVSRSTPRGKTTVIIPTRNRLSLLRRCLETIQPAVEKVSAEILIVDNDSTDPETLDYLDRICNGSTHVLRVEGPFNFARLNNIAAQSVSSDYLCLLNNDVEAMDEAWLDEMLGRIAEPDVGAVGSLLMWPSGVIQHGGVVLGASFAAHHAFNDRVDGDPGPADLLRVAHECSAVTAACLLTRRSDYLRVTGMDEVNFSVAFNDVDYCLKLRAMGMRIIFTPHARLFHIESASRGQDDKPDKKLRFQRELQVLRCRWASALLNDPYYSPVMSLDPVPYSTLAWPPRSDKARWPSMPTPQNTPPGI